MNLVNLRGAKVRWSSTRSLDKHPFTIPTVKHSASVMVWGCFSGSRGRGGYYFLTKNTTMRGENHLMTFMRIHRSTLFLQDGAPCHKLKLVVGKLKEMEKEFRVMDWPRNSHDFKPIENCCGSMKSKLKNDRAVTSLPKLIHTVKMMWVKDMPIDYFRKLSNLIPSRIER